MIHTIELNEDTKAHKFTSTDSNETQTVDESWEHAEGEGGKEKGRKIKEMRALFDV